MGNWDRHLLHPDLSQPAAHGSGGNLDVAGRAGQASAHWNRYRPGFERLPTSFGKLLPNGQGCAKAPVPDSASHRKAAVLFCLNQVRFSNRMAEKYAFLLLCKGALWSNRLRESLTGQGRYSSPAQGIRGQAPVFPAPNPEDRRPWKQTVLYR